MLCRASRHAGNRWQCDRSRNAPTAQRIALANVRCVSLSILVYLCSDSRCKLSCLGAVWQRQRKTPESRLVSMVRARALMDGCGIASSAGNGCWNAAEQLRWCIELAMRSARRRAICNGTTTTTMNEKRDERRSSGTFPTFDGGSLGC